jgi:hypothetical protein
MEKSVHGFVYHVTKHASGSIEIGFYDKDYDSADTYSTEDGKLTMDLAQTLAESLAHNIWAKIEFDAKGVARSVSLEEYDFGNDIYQLKSKLRRLVVTGS